MGITGPVISSALADGYGNTASSGLVATSSGNGGAPCTCCKDGSDNRRASTDRRGFFYNGSEYLQEIDLSLPGVMPIIIQRTYNNQSTFDSPLGYGWDFSLNDRLRTYADNSVVVRTTTGKKLHFIFTGGGYVCEENQDISLLQNPDGTFVFYESPVDMHYYFDIQGRLVRKEDTNGNSLRMTYSDTLEALIGTSPDSIDPTTPMIVSNNFQLQRIEQWNSSDTSTGRFVDFHYDINTGRLDSISDSTGRTISYQHDSSGNLTRIDYPEGLFKTYQYTDPNDSHNMTNNLRGYGTNPAVLQTSRQYDVEDRMIREEYAGGILEINYTIPLQKTTVTKTISDSQGTILHEFDTVYEFNSRGFLIQTTDEQKSVEFERDSRNNVIKKAIYLNTGSVTSPNLTLQSSKSFLFDTENNLIGSTIAVGDGEEIQTQISSNNGLVSEYLLYSTATPEQIHQTLIEYNQDAGLPTTVASAKILKSNIPVPTYDSVYFRYNNDAQPTEIQFDNGDTISMEYENGLLTKKDNTKISYNSRGEIIALEDANGNTTHYEYDNFGRRTKIINSLGEETVFTFTGWNLSRIEMGKTAAQPGRTVDFTYDDYGRLLQSSIDLSGTPVLLKTFTYDSDGNLLSSTDQQNNSSTATYNQWGQILTSTDANGNIDTYTYSNTGQLLSTTNALNQETTFEYDTLNRLVKVTSPMGGITRITYNELNKVLKVIDPELREFTFGYDLAGQTVWQKAPASAPVSYRYDEKGRVSQVTLPDGTINTYQYSRNNQLQQVSLNAGTAELITLRYGYDKAGNLLWYSDSSIGPDPSFQMTYDSLNRLETKTLVPIDKTLQFSYNHQGQRDTITLLDNSTELFHYSYTYDSAGRLTSLTEQQQSTSRTTAFSIDNIGLLIGKTYPNNVTASLSYDKTGLLEDLLYQKADSSIIDHFQYTFDALGKITEQTDIRGTSVFAYDALNHLTSADYPAASSLSDESFGYDQTGNRLTSTGITDWTYDSGGKLSSYNGHSLVYDTNGRQQTETVAQSTVSYSYDNLNRLINVQQSGSTSSFYYDYSNRRLKKDVNGTSIWYLHDGANVLAEFNQSGQLIRNYSYTPGSFDLLGVTEGTTYNAILTNLLQTPRYALNNSQSIVWQAEYQSYGKAIINNDMDNNGTIFTLNQRLPGQYADEETGLYQNWNRYYNPETGRYISRDPINLNGGINLYGYTDASPLNYIDPTGLVCDELNNDRTQRNSILMEGVEGVLFYGGGVAAGFGMAASVATVGPIVGVAGVFVMGGSFIGATLSSLNVLVGITAGTEKQAASASGSINDAALLVNPLASIFVLQGDMETAREAQFVWGNKEVLISALVATQDYDLALDVLNLINKTTEEMPKTGSESIKDRNNAMADAIKQAMEKIPKNTSIEGRTYEGSRKRVGNWLFQRVKMRQTQAPFQNELAPDNFSQEPVQ